MRKPTPLKVAIIKSGVMQRTIAEKIGMDEAHLSRIVNGLQVDDATRARIAEALGKTADELWPTDEQVAA